ncbi:MAG: crossover junction endodeoxyribonuclease RuvC [Demequinaceae bacterium]|nr:crossover junction endodeoxyribonuclease RuvC [Demequinaceae bacterium]
MRILGVDPGLTRCGIGAIEAGASRSVSLLSVSVATSDAGLPVPLRLASIADAVELALDEVGPSAVALERVFSQHNVRTVMGTAQVSGIVMLAAERRGIPVALYTPSEVKAAVTGNGRAAKAQVGEMVKRLLGAETPIRPADAADALAIAICHAWRGAGGGPAAGEGEAADGQGGTVAQRRWAEADRAARRRG